MKIYALSLFLLLQTATRVAAHTGISPDLVLGTGSPRSESSKLSNLLGRRQTRTCNNPAYVPCSNANFCCQPGQICQPNNPRGTGRGWCCPSYGLQCNGRACCNPATAICCGTTCCTKGFKCSNGQCIAPPPPPVTTPRTTSTFSTPIFSTATSCPLNGRDVEGRQLPNCPSMPLPRPCKAIS
ncbi:hypothetical protein FPV67DRAFT_274935 [Lyophyllum atratum]|nr:hypothetical protein FPV67DRAFT_274935 [Lyophyllum atratum]